MQACHNDWSVVETPYKGSRFMILNGAGNPNTKVWNQTVTVDPGVEYDLSAWVSSAIDETASSVAMLQFWIGGFFIGTMFSPSIEPGVWSRFFVNWRAPPGTQTHYEVAIVNLNTAPYSYDFGE